jgi:hypothetical protein
MLADEILQAEHGGNDTIARDHADDPLRQTSGVDHGAGNGGPVELIRHRGRHRQQRRQRHDQRDDQAPRNEREACTSDPIERRQARHQAEPVVEHVGDDRRPH